MNVKELIRELKKYPGDYQVGVAMHDNLEGEIAGNVFDVIEYDPEAPSQLDPEEGDWVILRCQ